MTILCSKRSVVTKPVKEFGGVGKLQARGQLDEAATTYKRAGTYFPIGDAYLQAADGYDRLGNSKFAWREALLSKYLQPFRPEVHSWLAGRLQAANHPEQSRIETELARLLAPGK